MNQPIFKLAALPLTKLEIAKARMGELVIEGTVYDRLYDHYTASGEMPYGTAKARDGDPYTWIADRLADEVK